MVKRRREALNSRFRDKAVVALDEPVRAGFVRYFVVRPDVRRSPEGHGPWLDRVLSLVQNEEYAGRRDFAQRDYARGGKMRPVPHRPARITPEQYHLCSEKVRSYFVLSVGRDRRSGHVGKPMFELKDPWKFATRVRPYYITHRELPNAEADSEYAYLDAKLHGPDWLYRHYLHGLRGCGWDRDDERAARSADLRRRFADQATDVAVLTAPQ